MPFPIRVRLLKAPGPLAKVLVRAPPYAWALDTDRSGTFDADLSGENIYLEIGALFSASAQPVMAGVHAQRARGLDIDQIDERSVEAHLLHAATPIVDERYCEIVCLSNNQHRKGPGCLDCAIGPYTIRVCC